MNGCGRGEVIKGKRGEPAELKSAKLGRNKGVATSGKEPNEEGADNLQEGTRCKKNGIRVYTAEC